MPIAHLIAHLLVGYGSPSECRTPFEEPPAWGDALQRWCCVVWGWAYKAALGWPLSEEFGGKRVQ